MKGKIMIIYSRNIVTPKGVVAGYLELDGYKIKAIHQSWDGEYIDHTEDIIMPGFIDVHIHGWGRGSFMYEKNAQSIQWMAKDLVKTGVTGFLATTAADSVQGTLRSIDAGNQVYCKFNEGAEILGIHLEGPFLNKTRRGMQPEEYCIDANIEMMKKFYETQEDRSMIKLMTIAPELPGAKEVIKFCASHNIQLSVGHSDANFEDIANLKEYGLGGVTHMYSGMKGLHHRELGVVGAALYFDDLYCEFAKQTGMTVRHEAFDIAFRIKGSHKIFLTTDCAGAARRTKESYHYVRKITYTPLNDKLILTHDDGRVEEYDTTNYNDIKNLEMGYMESVQNLMKHTPMPLTDLALLTSTNPAKYIGIERDYGSIQQGKKANLTIIDKNYDLVCTIVNGGIKYQVR